MLQEQEAKRIISKSVETEVGWAKKIDFPFSKKSENIRAAPYPYVYNVLFFRRAAPFYRRYR
tara:strand:+ start:89 stop:274 length:186 start_codon:yes stop_codon:yes gene_type:complete